MFIVKVSKSYVDMKFSFSDMEEAGAFVEKVLLHEMLENNEGSEKIYVSIEYYNEDKEMF